MTSVPQRSTTNGGTGAAGPSAAGLRDINKRFGGAVALAGVSLDIAPGEIHALVGENGAGKSTLLGVIAGRVAATSGRVEIFGEELESGVPRAARRAGVVAIYQELTIVPALSACANVFLGQTLSRGGSLDEGAMKKRFRELAERFGVGIDPTARAGELSVADQQILEVMRALQADARIILFDEPTAALAAAERDALHARMRDLRDHGVTMVYVSHNLDEVLSIADTVTVFRDGRLQSTAPAAELTKNVLVEEMLGAPLRNLTDEGAGVHTRREGSDARISLRALEVSVPGVLEDVSLELQEGEILGIAGLVGSGRSTLLRALAGAEPRSKGKLWIDGNPVRWPQTVRAAVRAGIGLVPEDRKRDGLVAMRSAMENITLSAFSRSARLGVISPSRMGRQAAEAGRAVGFDPARVGSTVASLSGGNQQKLLLARWLHRPPRVLLADEPTRGVDVGAKQEILETLRRLADDGLTIIVVSSELEELLAIPDRVIVLAGGRITMEADLQKEVITSRELLHAAFQLKAKESENAG